MKEKTSSKSIVIACDHAGYDLKQYLKKNLQDKNFEVVDLGCDSSSTSVDYPDITKKLSLFLNDHNQYIGILICGSGIGVSISANRYKFIRAALCNSVKLAKLARLHNNANVLCLGARIINNTKALSIVNNFLKTNFEGNRHEIRVKKLSE